jgi:hypothetical protein
MVTKLPTEIVTKIEVVTLAPYIVVSVVSQEPLPVPGRIVVLE